MTTKLKPFTFPDSGKKVLLQKVPTSVIMLDLMKKNPKPQAPIQAVNIAGHETHERNYAHPDYHNALTRWEQDIEAKAAELLLSMGVVIELKAETKKEINQKRAELNGYLPNHNDKMLWLRYIAIESDNDFQSLLKAIRNHSNPTQEGVANAQDSFQG